jgi:hypothetical protein
MKRFLILFLLLLIPELALAQNPATVTGHTIFPSNGPASNASVCFSLQNFKPNLPRVVTTGTIVQQQNWCIVPAADGSFSTPVDRNDFITPSGTFWRVDFLWNGLQQSSANFLINSTPFNLDTATPLSQIPIVGPNQIVTQVFSCPQLTANATWVCTHNFHDTNVQVQTFDLAGKVIYPDTVVDTSPNVVTITFVTAQAGLAVIVHAGSVAIATNQPNAVLQNPTGTQSINGGFSFSVAAPSLFSTSLIPPLKADPIAPLNGEFWINGEAFKWQGNSGSPVTHTASTFLPLTCGAGLFVNALVPDAVPVCAAPTVPQLTTLGDTLSVDATPIQVRVPGNTTATKLFYTQTGNGTISALPGWNAIVGGDVPQINLAASGAGGVGGNLPVTNLNSGTNADNVHFWRGDGTWASLGQSTFTDGSISGNVTINSTATNVKAISVTFPSSGCPCRAFLSYSLYLDFTGITNQANIDFWVDDGNSHVMAGVQTGQSNATTGAKTSATYGGYSTVTYNNSAGVTFTLKGIQSGVGGATVQAAPGSGSGPNSDFQVTVVPSVN